MTEQSLVLGGLAIAGAAVLAGRFVAKRVSSAPDTVQAAAGKIAEFDLPAGYEADYAMQVAGFVLAAYDPNDGHSHLMLIQFPAGTRINEAEMRRQLERATRRAGAGDYDGVQVVGQNPVSIRGQQATATLSEGVNSDGQPYRSVMVAFEGKGGPALLVFEEPVSRWDQSRVDAFIGSVR